MAVEQLKNSDPGMQEPMDLINWELNTLCKENFIAWTAGEITKQECHEPPFPACSPPPGLSLR